MPIYILNRKIVAASLIIQFNLFLQLSKQRSIIKNQKQTAMIIDN